MEDQLCFVQFLHPGREHEPETHDRKEWNVRDQQEEIPAATRAIRQR